MPVSLTAQPVRWAAQIGSTKLGSAARPRSSTTQLDSATCPARLFPRQAWPLALFREPGSACASERARWLRARPTSCTVRHRLEQVADGQRSRRSWLAASKGERQLVSRTVQRPTPHVPARRPSSQDHEPNRRRVQAARHQDRGRRCGGVMRRTLRPFRTATRTATRTPRPHARAARPRLLAASPAAVCAPRSGDSCAPSASACLSAAPRRFAGSSSRSSRSRSSRSSRRLGLGGRAL